MIAKAGFIEELAEVAALREPKAIQRFRRRDDGVVPVFASDLGIALGRRKPVGALCVDQFGLSLLRGGVPDMDQRRDCSPWRRARSIIMVN